MATSDKLSKCQKAFESWRNGRKGKEKIPDKLWQMAIALLDERPISHVAKELRLNATHLRQKQLAFKQLETPSKHTKEQTPFLELNQFLTKTNDSSGFRSSTLQLLVERADGHKLTLTLNSSQRDMVQNLLTAFIRS